MRFPKGFPKELWLRWWKAIIGFSSLSELPKACRWIAEQWAGNKVSDWLEALGPRLWGWMASHPILSLAATTSLVVFGFSVETKIWEKRRAKGEEMKPIAQPMIESAASSATPTTFKGVKDLADKFMRVGDEEIRVEFRPDNGSIQIAVIQFLDRDQGLDGTIFLLDLRQLIGGIPTAVEPFHPDRKFKFAEGRLARASSGNLFYAKEKLWWLVQCESGAPLIRLSWTAREGPNIEVPEGQWIADLKIDVGSRNILKKVKFSRASHSAKVVLDGEESLT